MKSRKQFAILVALLLFQFISILSVQAQKDRVKLQEYKVCSSITKRQLLETQNDKSSSTETEVENNSSKNNGSQILLPLINMLNIHYDTELYIGKKKSPFKLVVDTGSTALWIPDIECTNCKQNNLWKLYNCDQSSSCQTINKDQKEYTTIEYGVGSVQGYAVKELIYLSDKDQTGFEYEFFLVNSVSGFKVLQIQGILGLGREEGSEFKNQSILRSMKEKGVIDQRVFSLFLSDSSCLGNSVLVFGGYNEDYKDGEITYIKVNSEYSWSVDLSSASLVLQTEEKQQENSNISNQIQQDLNLISNTTVIDSGTTKIVLPKQDLNILMESLKKTFNIPCDLEKRSVSAEILTVVCLISDYSKYPTFQFTLGKKDSTNRLFELTPDDYIDTCFYNLQVRKCALLFQHIDTDYILLGDTFLRKYYTVFDMEKERIGFAPAKIIQPKSFYETSLFGAYLGVFITISLLLFFIIVCKFYTMYQDYAYEKKHSVKAQSDSPPNTTGPDDLHTHGSHHIEMHQGPHNQSVEDPNDVSEEISQDDISDMDQSHKNQQSYRQSIPKPKPKV